MAAVAPKASTAQARPLAPASCPTNSATTSSTVQTVSFRKVQAPRPAAKKAYRQLSCRVRAGSTTPKETNSRTCLAVEQGAQADTGQAAHDADKERRPPEAATAPRQRASGGPLKRTASGSVETAREQFSTTEYARNPSPSAPRLSAPMVLAT